MIHICLGCPVSCITSPLHNWGETIWSALFPAYISDYGFSYYFRLSLIIRWAKHSPPTMYFRFPKALYAVYLGVDIRQKYCLKNNRTKVLLHYPGNSGRPSIGTLEWWQLWEISSERWYQRRRARNFQVSPTKRSVLLGNQVDPGHRDFSCHHHSPLVPFCLPRYHLSHSLLVTQH